MKILVVEDEPAILRYIYKLLRTRGHEVLALLCDGSDAANDALEHVRHIRFDAVLVGYMMPGLTGTDAAVQIKRLSAATHVVIMIERVPPDETDRLQRQGITFGQLPAPFEKEDLFRQLSVAAF